MSKRKRTRKDKIKDNVFNEHSLTAKAKYGEQLGYKKIHLTESQQELFKKISENTITFVEGPAGSSKTLTALYYAVQNYLINPSDEIVIIRTPIESNSDKIGFLPSSLSDKLEPHFASTKILLNMLLTSGKVDADLDKRIHFKIPNYCLGCTFSNGLVLIDECFTEEHQFLTQDGWKYCEFITEEDSVTQYNPDGTTELVKPSRIIHKEYKGKVVSYVDDNIEFCVTPNHRIIFEKEDGSIKEILAQDLLLEANDTLSFIVETKDGYKKIPYNPSKLIINGSMLGKVHCVTVPSGMLLVKVHDKIHVSGNCQELSPLIMKLLLERIGPYTKVVVCGDPTQVYSHSKDRQGMMSAMKRFFEVDKNQKLIRDELGNLKPIYDNITYHKFTTQDVVRSDIVKTVIDAYSKNPL